LEVEVALEETTPGRHVDVHLIWARHLTLLAEDFLLPPQLWPAGDHRVQKFDLRKNIKLF
jgi:hypothetical protein